MTPTPRRRPWGMIRDNWILATAILVLGLHTAFMTIVWEPGPGVEAVAAWMVFVGPEALALVLLILALAHRRSQP